jgi:predicted DNA-binding transcriptional regulator AlpA
MFDLEFIRADVLRKKFGISRTTLWRYIKNGTFPPPIELGPGVRGLAGFGYL